MDNEIRQQINEALELLKKVSFGDIDFDNLDPVAKMLLVAVINEGEKIVDSIESIPDKIIERYSSDFIPYDKVGATPALTIISPEFVNSAFPNTITIENGISFFYKNKDTKTQLNYLPIFRTLLVPFSNKFILSGSTLIDNVGIVTDSLNTGYPNSIWIGLETPAEMDTLKGLSFLINGTEGVLPKHVYVVSENRNSEIRELEFSSMFEMENIGILEPFDAQQSSNILFSIIEKWKDTLLNMENSAIFYITDEIRDRDVFKRHTFPKCFQLWFENDLLDRFSHDILWLRLDFPEHYIVSDNIDIKINVVPVVNVDVNNVTLTQGNPIAKLQKGDNSFFIQVLETNAASNKQGFDMLYDMITIRDFEASRYDNSHLYRDIRMLYNSFLDDYYAFVEYNQLRDGELLSILRETINKLGKSVGEYNDKFKFNNGTYVMRHINQVNQNNSIRVSFMTTMGNLGNKPRQGEMMETRRLPGICHKVPILLDADGGSDKASPDARYELLRYYTLTNDRLFTKMDIDAFLRKEIMLTFGKNEFHRIFIRIQVEGAGSEKHLCRGLYIDIEFKDKKNYTHAIDIKFDQIMKRKITALSCLSMPVIISLVNLDQ